MKKLNAGELSIQDILPHRGQWLLIKEIASYNDNRIKVITWFEEAQCWGHFPEELIVPGQLLAEAIVQAGAYLVLSKSKEGIKKLFLLKESIRFKKIVSPGEILEINVKLTSAKIDIFFFEGEIKNENKETIVSGTFAGRT